MLTSDTEKAEAFNAYFSSVFTRESTGCLDRLDQELRATRSADKVKDVVLTEDEVYEELCRIDSSKASGPDEIPGRLLREGAPWITKPLLHLFNASLNSGKLPSDWTKANVIPVFKKGNKHSAKNYRPVSLTSLVVKVLERLIQRRIVKFFDDNGKLNTSQHGFRQAHSCQTQLLETIHHWAKSLDSGASSHVIFLDFAKAFDSVAHERLLLKLDHIGVRGKLLSWIRGFLTNRQQRVVCNGHSSAWARVISGVPQGSILGPLLFLVYVNDVSVNLVSPTRLFADDCVIYRQVVSTDDCVTLQEDLARLYAWSQRWQLALNLSKCKAVCISNQRNPPSYTYGMNNVVLEWVDTFKYLGVRLDSKLKWGAHVAEITAKANRTLSLLRRTMQGCSRDAKTRAYCALVRPHLEYCAPAWNPYQLKDCAKLEKVQQRAARWVGSQWDPSLKKWSKSYQEICAELHWPTLELRRQFLICCQVFKIIHSLDCISFSEYLSFTRASSTRSHNLTLFCSRSRINSFRYSFFVNCPFVWNKLPYDVVNVLSIGSFKAKLRNVLYS